MEIHFRNRKLAKQFETANLSRVHGTLRASIIRKRMLALEAASNLGAFWPPYSTNERCHELKFNLKGKFSIDLDHPYRLIFEPANNPIPKTDDGGTDWFAITEIIILGLEDTHE